ncbi:hypothetical protein FRC12_025080 [Ceratobasidium sp. 428]|nr:hypothetical protein FRC12_025080 [Ceratobasidium sp. 428]
MSAQSAQEVSLGKKLPSEVLARIFALAKVHCIHEKCSCGCGRTPIHDHPHKFDTFVGVCAHWYKVAINTPNLWNHIDIGPKIPARWTRLLLKRTKETPVQLHVYVGEKTPTATSSLSRQKPKPEYKVSGALLMLACHIYRVRSLELAVHARSDEELVTSIVQLWFNFGSPNPHNSVVTYWPDISHGEALKLASPEIYNDRLGNVEKMMLSIGDLRCVGMIPGWGPKTFYNLVNLQLLRITMHVSLFTSMLFASQDQLETLELGQILILREPNWRGCDPISMSRLRLLNLLSLQDEDSVRLVLPLIGLPSILGERRVSLRVQEKTQDILAQFFARSYMTFLYCHTDSQFIPSRPLMISLPSVDLLVLSNFNLWKEPAVDKDANSLPIPVNRLPYVALWDCIIRDLSIENFITQRQIKNLHVLYRSGNCPPEAIHVYQAFRADWMRVFPGLKCDISMIGPGKLPFFSSMVMTPLPL